MLYENPSPYLLREPPGTLDTTNAIYEQLDDVTVRVSGSSFQPQPYSVRLEGVSSVGYRSLCLAGLRDPAVIDEIDNYTSSIADLLGRSAPRRFGIDPSQYTIRFRRYGMDAVLGSIEPQRGKAVPHEVGLVIEVVGRTQDIAHQLVAASLPYVMHGVHVKGAAHSANAALAYSPAVIDLGEAFRWSVWHAAKLDDPMEPFRIEYSDVMENA